MVGPVGGGGHLPLRPLVAPDAGLRHRHPAPDGVGLAPHRSRLLVHPHRRRRPLSAHARQRRLLSDGLGRQRPAHRTSRAELLRRALRPGAPLRPVLLAAREAGPRSRLRCRDRTSSSCATGSWSRTKRRSSTCGGRSACRWTGARPTPPSTPRSRRTSQRAFLADARAGHVYSAEAPTQWDVDFQTAVSQAEMEDRELARRLPPAALRTGRGRRRGRHRDDAPGAARRVRRARRPPRRRALPAAVRSRRVHAVVRGPRSRSRPPPRRSPKGLGHRHDLHLRRHHRRDVVARAVPCRRGPSWGATAGCAPCRGADEGWSSRRPRHRRTCLRRARGSYGLPGPDAASSRCSARRGRSWASPKPIRHPVKFYERGERPLEIVSSRQWYVRTLALRERLLERGRELRWHPDVHAAPVSRRGWRA